MMKIEFKHLQKIADENSDIRILTNSNGIDVQKKKSYPAAYKAAQSLKGLLDEDIFWQPIIFNNEVTGVLGVINDDQIKEKISFINNLIEALSFELFSEKINEEMLNSKSNFIKKILTDTKIKNIDTAIDLADILGLNIRSPQAVLLIKIPGLVKNIHKKRGRNNNENPAIFAQKEYRKIERALNKGFKNYEQNIFAFTEPEKIVCLKWARGQINTLNTIKFFCSKAKYIAQIIKEVTGITPTIGIGQYYPGISGLRKSYSDAQTALSLGERIWGSEKNYHITDVGMFVALSRKTPFERKSELASQIIGSIFEDKESLKTVSTFLELNMSLTEVAKKMKIHRNTLIYRLEKIKKETGLDARNFTDAVQIKLGLILYGPKDFSKDADCIDEPLHS